MIVFNYIGLIMTVIAFAVAFAIGSVIGTNANGLLMIIAGPLLVAMDVTYRLKMEDGHILVPHRGGSLFFLPAWVFGALWFVLGIVNTIQGEA